MQVILRERLWVLYPGPLRAELQRLAWFKRKGRLRSGDPRWLQLWVETPAALGLPRELWWRIQDRHPWQVQDQRVAFAPLDWHWRGKLRPYQGPAVETLQKLGGGVLVAPPGSGKTTMGLYLVAAWGQPTLFIVPSLDLLHQVYDRARELFRLPPSAIQVIGGGQAATGTHLTVATVQSLYTNASLTRWLLPRVGTVAVDEAHKAAAKIYQTLLHQFPGKFRIGLSATPNREDGLGPAMVATLGRRVAIPKPVLLSARAIVVPRVIRVETGWRYHGPKAWAAMERARAGDPGRNQLLLRVVLAAWQRKRRTLVLVERTDHVDLLVDQLRRLKVPVVGLVGDVDAGTRERHWAALGAGREVVVATKLANEGVDIPTLDCLILGAAGRSHTRLEQQIGRAMRAVAGKAVPEVWDCCDTQVAAYRRHAGRRLTFYRTEGYPVVRPETVLQATAPGA